MSDVRNPPGTFSKRGGRFSARLRWLTAMSAIALASTYFVHRAAHAVTQPADVSVPSVAAVRTARQDLYREITVPAEFRAYTEVDVHAKVAGYVQRINVDIGDRVRAGQLLAVLEIPELHDDLDRGIAAQQRAAADYKDAHLAYSRLLEVNREHPNLLAQQDIDTAEARAATAEAALTAAKSDVEKYRTLVGYTRIMAPFAGVVTRRYADPGALIQAGTASQTQAMPLVRVSDNELLRLDFPVSVDYVPAIRTGASVTVRVDSLGNREIEGKIARTTDRVDDSTRTMLVELEIPNPSLELVPGMYAHVTLRVEQRAHALAIPVEAVGPGKSVLVVDTDHRLEERRVTLGLETATAYEVLAGLKDGDVVVIGNPQQLLPGEKVDSRLDEPLTGQ